MKLEFSRQVFEKYSSIEFHENLSSGSRVVTCGQADLTKLIVAFRNLTNAPNSVFLGFTHQKSIVDYLVKKFRHIMKSKVCCRVL